MNTKKGWVITVDHLENKKDCAKGIVSGPHDMNVTLSELAIDGKYFELYDDDEVLYYSGFVIGDELAPLEDFGMPDSGCTMVKINNEYI